MVGVTGSIPVAPTIKRPEKSGISASLREGKVASQCLNKPRTVPKSRIGLGKRRAECSRKVRRCNQPKFGKKVRERKASTRSSGRRHQARGRESSSKLGSFNKSLGDARCGGDPSRLHDLAEAFAVAASVHSNCALVRPGRNDLVCGSSPPGPTTQSDENRCFPISDE